MASYRSWIPTVSLRLSFSEIGTTKHPTKCLYKNFMSHGRRRVFVSQERFLLDTAFPGNKYIKAAYYYIRRKAQGRFIFVFVGATPDNPDFSLEHILGSVYVCPKYSFALTRFFSAPQYIVKCTVNAIGRLPHLRPAEWLERDLTRFDSSIERHCIYKANIHLTRTGSFHLYAGRDPNHRITRFTRFEKIVAEQAYYFVKDICHNHQHHDPYTDTVIGLHKDGSKDWRREVRYCLFRKIIQYKRAKGQDNLFESLGILAYARAFITLCKHDSLTTAHKDNSLIEYYNTDELENSIKAAQAAENWQSLEKIRRSDAFRNITLWAIGFIISLCSLLKEDDRNKIILDPIVTDMIQSAASNVWVFLILGVIFYVVIKVILNHRRYFTTWRIFYDLIALAHVFGPRSSGMILVLLFGGALLRLLSLV